MFGHLGPSQISSSSSEESVRDKRGGSPRLGYCGLQFAESVVTVQDLAGKISQTRKPYLKGSLQERAAQRIYCNMDVKVWAPGMSTLHLSLEGTAPLSQAQPNVLLVGQEQDLDQGDARLGQKLLGLQSASAVQTEPHTNGSWIFIIEEEIKTVSPLRFVGLEGHLGPTFLFLCCRSGARIGRKDESNPDKSCRSVLPIFGGKVWRALRMLVLAVAWFVRN
mmetsp:Transcript_8002/g.15287  ORF Transcript_8002/g.15287 Transcript_8002/m.15287 type:complete len:221 (-) Transcript_8002:3256-3918(-)